MQVLCPSTSAVRRPFLRIAHPTEISVRWLGTQPYLRAWHLQRQLAAAVDSGDCPPTLLLLQHPPTYTVGRSGALQNLLWDEDKLSELGIELHHVDRGGDITYHGPGQLVGYPILPLGPVDHRDRIPRADYVGYVHRLEGVLIESLAELGLKAFRRQAMTGVWVPSASTDVHAPAVPPAKIVSIGIRVNASGISQHGFALNVDPDMEPWQGIVACGIPGAEMTSLAQLMPSPPSLTRVTEIVIRQFARVFNVRLLGKSTFPHSPA